jgi:acyl-CoA thioester hydrolase
MTDPKVRPARNEFRYWWPITVRWKDMDMMGHVNNSTYFTYLESARIGFLEARGCLGTLEGASRTGTVVVSQTFHYRRQVRYPNELEVGVRCSELRTRSFVLEYAIFRRRSDELVGNGFTVLAWLDYAAGQAIEIPPDMRKALMSGADDRCSNPQGPMPKYP